MEKDGGCGDSERRTSAIRSLGDRLRNRGRASGMRFNPFGLFGCKVVGIVQDAVDPAKLFNDCIYTHLAGSGTAVRMLERREAAGTTTSDIRTAHEDGIDNTGNFHWPAEEVLAHMMLTPATVAAAGCPGSPAPLGCTLTGHSVVLEIGAGVALAGLAYATAFPGARVVITDGNRSVVDVARQNIARLAEGNGGGAGEPRVHATQLLWHEPDRVLDEELPWLVDAVDVIVGADCLFFDRFHSDLKALLLRFLRREREPPTVIIVAPTRGTTLQRFVALMTVEADIAVDVSRDYDPRVTAMHEQLARDKPPEYVEDRHYPLRLVIRRKLC